MRSISVCYHAHLDKLQATSAAHPSDDMDAWAAAMNKAMREATALTKADGIPTADEVAPPRAPAMAPADGISTASVPPAVRDDIEYTRAMSGRPPGAPLPPTPFAAPIIDVLGPYRGTGMSDNEPQAEDR
jgi:hypothetical protein